MVSVDIDSSGTIAASNSLDSHIRLWNLETGEGLQSIDAGPVNAWTVELSKNSEFLATSTQSGTIDLYNIKTGDRYDKVLDSAGNFVMCLAIVSKSEDQN